MYPRKSKIGTVSNKKLFAFMMEIGSKFVDLIINALTHPKAERYKFFHSRHNDTSNEEENSATYIVDILNKYNKQLKKNLNEYKEKSSENNLFSTSYKTFKIVTNKVFDDNTKNPQELFRDLISKYREKNYILSPKFVAKNLFKDSPLLMLSQVDLIRFFTVDNVLNGLNSLGQKKSIFFLKRLQEDLNEMVQNSKTGFKDPHMMYKSQSCKNINSVAYKQLQFENNIFALHKFQQEIDEMNRTKREINGIEKLINVYSNENEDEFHTMSLSKLNFKKKGVLPNIANMTNSTLYTTTKTKTCLKQKMLIKNNSQSLLKSQNNIKEHFDDSLSSIRHNKTKSLIESTYDELKNYSVHKRNKAKINSLLGNCFTARQINDLDSKNASKDLLSRLSLLRNKVEVTNVKKIMNKIYNNKLPKKLSTKVDITQELDHKLKTLDLDLVKSMIKEKIKSK